MADWLEMLELVTAVQTARLCDVALEAWAPTTVKQYSKQYSLVECNTLQRHVGGIKTAQKWD